MNPVNRRTYSKLLLAATLAALSGTALSHPGSDTENPVLEWNAVALQAVRNTRMAPPMVARALSILHTCMYDAWSAYDPHAAPTVSVAGLVKRPPSDRTDANRRRAVSYAAYAVLADLFPSQKTALLDPLMGRLGYPPPSSMDLATAEGIGNVIARTSLDLRYQDGSNQLSGYIDYTSYRPVNTVDSLVDPNRWQPVPVSNGTTMIVPGFLAPHWQKVTPFALPSADALRPGPPAAYPHGSYRAQANQILHLTARLTDREKIISEYWSDGPASETPPGHWNVLAQWVSRRDRHTLDADVKMFFALNNALLDASIASWDCKRHYDSVRPISAIRFLYAGKPVRSWAGPYGGVRLIDGSQWLPYQPASFVTPPFAEYVSGHSTFSAAAAEILRKFTGSPNFGYSHTVPAGSSRIEPGLTPREAVTLAWPTFKEAADEAGMSRLYGGIHFEQGDLAGRQMGQGVGKLVWQKAVRLFAGERLP